MALQKKVMHVSGAEIEYWRIVGRFMDDLNKVGRYVLAGYVSEEARRSGRPPLDRKVFPIPSEKYEMVSNARPVDGAETEREQNATTAYTYIKALAAELKDVKPDHPLAVFADAEDV